MGKRFSNDPGVCKDCTQPTEPGRTYCWRCINYWQRYGMRSTELFAHRVEEGSACPICQTSIRRITRKYKDMILCNRCYGVVKFLENPRVGAIVSNIMSLGKEPTRHDTQDSVTDSPIKD